jgi:prephenate dehydratase
VRFVFFVAKVILRCTGDAVSGAVAFAPFGKCTHLSHRGDVPGHHGYTTGLMTTVAYQGEPGAWSEQAAFDFFGSEAHPLPHAQFEDAFAAVAHGHADYGCIPVENSLGGSVHKNYDLLMRHDGLRIVGETVVRVRWCLITHPGVTLADIDEVSSHWQALAQTERTLSQLLPNASRKEAYDTAGSVKLLKQSGNPRVAALASRRAAEIYDLPVLKEGLEDDPTNFTRFVIVSKADRPLPVRRTHTAFKTSIVFALRNVPGALFRALAAFSLRDVDLFKIESRPLQGSPWEYLFYIDFRGDASDPACARALDHLAEFATILRVLGSFPSAEMPV